MKRSGPLEREELEAAALRYLNRFDSSAKNLTRVLNGYVAKVAKERGSDAASGGADWVRELVARYVENGIVSDARFADTLASGLRRRGSSRRAIEWKLKARGVSDAVASEALTEVDRETDGNAELEAARAFVRRRRLGPFRPEAERATHRQKDLGALARAGFSFEIARLALGAQSDDDESF